MIKKLDYTNPSFIAQIEDERGRNFFDCLAELGSKPGFSSMLFLFLCGGGTQEQYNEVFKKGGFVELMTLISGGLMEAGFLGEKQEVDYQELRKMVKASMDEALANAPQAVLKPIGKPKKA